MPGQKKSKDNSTVNIQEHYSRMFHFKIYNTILPVNCTWDLCRYMNRHEHQFREDLIQGKFR